MHSRVKTRTNPNVFLCDWNCHSNVLVSSGFIVVFHWSNDTVPQQQQPNLVQSQYLVVVNRDGNLRITTRVIGMVGYGSRWGYQADRT